MSDRANISAWSLAELTAHIQSALHVAGIQTVLSGGSCVTIWSNNAYISDDIDLITDGLSRRSEIRMVMLELGFTEKNRYFIHPGTNFIIEFPTGPVTVGEERPQQINQMHLSTGTLTLLSPLDCMKDRLTWWFHHGDKQCLNQAIAVAKHHSINKKELIRWSKNEGKADEFRKIEALFIYQQA
jgi:hypothetical protein